MQGLWGPLVAVLLSLLPATRVATTVQVAEPPPPITAPATSRCPEWFAAALDAGFTAEEWPTVDRIMHCESQCQPTAYNRRSGASGLMQIMGFWHHGRDAFDPATNLAMAHEIYEIQGWRAWSCY